MARIQTTAGPDNQSAYEPNWNGITVNEYTTATIMMESQACRRRAQVLPQRRPTTATHNRGRRTMRQGDSGISMQDDAGAGVAFDASSCSEE